MNITFKRIIISIILISFSLFSSAQWKYSFKLGSAFSSYSGNEFNIVKPAFEIYNNEKGLSEIRAGFYIAANATYELTKNWQIESGLTFNTNKSGASTIFNVTSDLDEPAPHPEYLGVHKVSISSKSVQLPLYIAYKIELADNLSLTPKVGMWAGFGLSASSRLVAYLEDDKIGYADYNPYEEFKYKLTADDELRTLDPISRFDYGLGLRLQLQSGNILIEGGADFGFFNVGPGNSPYNSRVYSVTLGYMF